MKLRDLAIQPISSISENYMDALVGLDMDLDQRPCLSPRRQNVDPCRHCGRGSRSRGSHSMRRPSMKDWSVRLAAAMKEATGQANARPWRQASGAKLRLTRWRRNTKEALVELRRDW